MWVIISFIASAISLAFATFFSGWTACVSILIVMICWFVALGSTPDLSDEIINNKGYKPLKTVRLAMCLTLLVFDIAIAWFYNSIRIIESDPMPLIIANILVILCIIAAIGIYRWGENVRGAP